jgi:hypothetical protein
MPLTITPRKSGKSILNRDTVLGPIISVFKKPLHFDVLKRLTSDLEHWK